MTTYEQVHAGDIVLGYDGQSWGVESVHREPTLAVVLVRYGQRLVARPPGGTPITVLDESDVSAEWWAAQTLAAAGMAPVIISETWESA